MKHQPYISCAIEALFAANNFNFRYQNMFNSSVQKNWKELINYLTMHKQMVSERKFYIDERDILLLKPIEGDIIDTNSMGILTVLSNEMYDKLEENDFNMLKYTSEAAFNDHEDLHYLENWYLKNRIIERGRKPFPKIEWKE